LVCRCSALGEGHAGRFEDGLFAGQFFLAADADVDVKRVEFEPACPAVAGAAGKRPCVRAVGAARSNPSAASRAVASRQDDDDRDNGRGDDHGGDHDDEVDDRDD
jgi:hypothetical protein